jgi:hypothetical protein
MTKLLTLALPTAWLAGGLATAGYAATAANHETRHTSSREVVKIADARLKFEINATDQDGGIHVRGHEIVPTGGQV